MMLKARRPGYWITMGVRERTHTVARHFVGRLAADVPRLPVRIGADDLKVAASLYAPVTGAHGEHQRVARVKLNHASAGAAQLQRCATGEDPENLMGGRMVVVVAVDAIAPVGQPAMPFEDLLEPARRSLTAIFDCAAVNDDRQPGMVRHPAVPLKMEALNPHLRDP